MSAATNARRQAALRARRAQAGLVEVRGIFAPPVDHQAIKAAAAAIARKRSSPKE